MSPLLLDVLRQLSSTDFLSGQVLAQRLGCSRASVHSAIAEALGEGVAIHAVRGRGYRLAAPLTWLDPECLNRSLVPLGMTLRCYDQQDSTNTTLMRWAQSGAPHRAVVAAEWQSQGRGRRGRSWLGGLGNGLAFSLLWRSPRPAAELSGLSLAVGVSLARTLGGLGLSAGRVKWPNDILVADAKLAGVLIELSGDMLGPSAAVIGVGVNVGGSKALSGLVGQPVTDLQTHLGPLDRNTLLLDLLRGLSDDLERFEGEGFASFRQEWHDRHAFQGREVRIDLAGGEGFHGIARGVDEQGALLVETADGLRRLHSGEVSVRVVGS